MKTMIVAMIMGMLKLLGWLLAEVSKLAESLEAGLREEADSCRELSKDNTDAGFRPLFKVPKFGI